MAIRILEKQCYRVEVVGNGKEACEALVLAPYDLILLDVKMPATNSLEATRAIRDKEAGRPTRPLDGCFKSFWQNPLGLRRFPLKNVPDDA